MAQYLDTAKKRIALAKLPRFHYNQTIFEIVKYTIEYKLLFMSYRVNSSNMKTQSS